MSSRPYKSALPVDESVRIITNGRGTQFDPAVVDAFTDSLTDFCKIRQQVTRSQQQILEVIGSRTPHEDPAAWRTLDLASFTIELPWLDAVKLESAAAACL